MKLFCNLGEPLSMVFLLTFLKEPSIFPRNVRTYPSFLQCSFLKDTIVKVFKIRKFPLTTALTWY